MAHRQTNFNVDRKVYGPVGENDLYNIINNSDKKERVENIADDTRFKDFDIDIIQYNDKGTDREKVLSDLRNGVCNDKEHYVLYEVKSDTWGLTTGNIDYEYWDCRAGKKGCAARSKCDYFYYAFLEEVKPKVYRVKRRFIMKMAALRKYIAWREQYAEDRKFRRYHMYDQTSGDETENYLINIEELKKYNIAKEI